MITSLSENREHPVDREYLDTIDDQFLFLINVFN
jgi:hypothetical protein